MSSDGQQMGTHDALSAVRELPSKTTRRGSAFVSVAHFHNTGAAAADNNSFRRVIFILCRWPHANCPHANIDCDAEFIFYIDNVAAVQIHIEFTGGA